MTFRSEADRVAESYRPTILPKSQLAAFMKALDECPKWDGWVVLEDWVQDILIAQDVYKTPDWLPVAVWEAYEEWLDEPSVSWKLGLGD